MKDKAQRRLLTLLVLATFAGLAQHLNFLAEPAELLALLDGRFFTLFGVDLVLFDLVPQGHSDDTKFFDYRDGTFLVRSAHRADGLSPAPS